MCFVRLMMSGLSVAMRSARKRSLSASSGAVAGSVASASREDTGRAVVVSIDRARAIAAGDPAPDLTAALAAHGPAGPLAVRSGAAVSLPGGLDTMLGVDPADVVAAISRVVASARAPRSRPPGRLPPRRRHRAVPGLTARSCRRADRAELSPG